MVGWKWLGGELVRHVTRLGAHWWCSLVVWHILVVIDSVVLTGISWLLLPTIVYWLQKWDGSMSLIRYSTTNFNTMVLFFELDAWVKSCSWRRKQTILRSYWIVWFATDGLIISNVGKQWTMFRVRQKWFVCGNGCMLSRFTVTTCVCGGSRVKMEIFPGDLAISAILFFTLASAFRAQLLWSRLRVLQVWEFDRGFCS